MLLAFVKATDTRRDASFVVSRDPKTPEEEYDEEITRRITAKKRLRTTPEGRA